MPHQQEPTDTSIVSADGLAAFAEQRRRSEVEEGFEAEGMSAAEMTTYRNGAANGGACRPPSSAPAQYRPYASFSPPPSTPSLSSHPSSSFRTTHSLPPPSPSYYSHSPQPSFPPPAALPSPSFPSSGSTPSYSHGLPAFSRWSPTWYSGSVDGDGRGVTNHPPFQHQQQPWERPESYFPPLGRVRDPFQDGDEAGDLGEVAQRRRWMADEEDEEEEHREKGDYHLPAGTYQHGVGFDSHSGNPLAPKPSDRRRERLERKFGVSPSSPTSPSSSSNPSKSFSFAAAKAARRKEKQNFRERAGVDEKGRLVVEKGRKKRKTARWAEGVGAVVVGVGSIGSAFTHPDPVPPPSGSAPLIALYLLPFASLAVTLYLHAVRPTLYKRRQGRQPQAGFGAGGMVVPLVQGGGGGMQGGGGCCGRRKEKRMPRGMIGGMKGMGKYQPQQLGTTVNLVVDPSMFPALARPKTPQDEEREREKRRRRRKREKKRREKEKRPREKGEPGADDHESLVSSSSSISSLSSSESEADADPSNPYSRKSILSSPLALEPLFLGARSWTRQVALVEVLAGCVWTGVGVWGIGWGGQCKPGTGSGFCDLYNLALAFSILTALAFFTSATFAIIDLARTKGKNPRWRQAKAPGGGGGGIV